jgi:hypothetical protein
MAWTLDGWIKAVPLRGIGAPRRAPRLRRPHGRAD